MKHMHRGHTKWNAFLMIKPDAVQRNLIGEIISRIEKKGLKLVGGKFMQVPMELAENIIVNIKENRSTTS